ncbi:MAG: tryptophan 2,3-dioxygenase [Bacteroidetes bacterium]|nr:tryptophan 2,3-dioxygenase [Bacteroidota bacterium]PHX82278.1 MAG: tryptophan 2,3-dioxygenase [Flavobacteriales bacterium]
MSDIKPDQLETLKKINEKYNALGQDAGAFLKGFSYSKPVNYWDYIQLETLLSLQRPRTDYPDEPIFIMYHQVTELLLKLIVHELKQVVDAAKKEIEFFKTKIERVNRYASVLTQSFGVMREGMDYDQYNDFRLSLAPASGLQSNQFRVVEIMCTDLHNLVNTRVKGKLPVDANLDQLFDELYWKDAGLDRKTGKKTQTLKQFEDKYIDELKGLAMRMKTQNVLCRFLDLSENEVGYLELKNALRDFDHTYNVVWPLSHLKTAEHYLNFKGEVKPATGGSDWQKYLHPSFQRRIFFPQLWSEDELKNWGNF